jgi:transporter family protein
MSMIDWRIYALGSASFAALTAVLAKLGVVDIDSNLATFIRTVVILALCALAVTIRGHWDWHTVSPRSLRMLALSGVATGLSWLCYFKALQSGPASRVAPIDKLSVVLVVLLAALFLRESLTLKVGIGAVLITAGAILMAV